MFSGTEMLFLNDLVASSSAEIPTDQAASYREYFEGKLKAEREKAQTDVVASRTDTRLSARPQSSKEDAMVPRKRTKATERRVYLDSKHRNRSRHPNAGDFTISWGRTFQNVVSIRLNDLQFPNVDQVINNSNCVVSWINWEDRDLDPPFPIYSVTVKPGSYTLTTLASELTEKLNSVPRHLGQRKRDGRLPENHYFIVGTSYDTDYVSFTSIITFASPSNPVRVIGGLSTVFFNQTNHGFREGETVHIIGVKGVIGGMQPSTLNRSFPVHVVSESQFSFETGTAASFTATGGGTLVKVGREAPFQLLFGDPGNVSGTVGFREENSAASVPVEDPLTSITKLIVDAISDGTKTKIVCPGHRLRIGDRVMLHNFFVFPSVYQNIQRNGMFIVESVPSPDVFVIDYQLQSVSDITNAFAGVQNIEMYWPNHGFNRIHAIEQIGPNLVQITTLFDHGLGVVNDDLSVLLSGTNCVPPVDGFYDVVGIVSTDVFTISAPANADPLLLTDSGTKGILSSDYVFYLYNVMPFGGFTSSDLNNTPFVVRDIIDADTFTFQSHYGFSNIAESGGGSDIRINSKLPLHGWQGVHTNNDSSGELIRPVTLAGIDYAFMCLPGLGLTEVSYSGPVKDILTKIYISEVPGYRIFNDFDPAPLRLSKPIASLSELRVAIKSPDDALLNFNELDYSFGLTFECLEEADEPHPDNRAVVTGNA